MATLRKIIRVLTFGQASRLYHFLRSVHQRRSDRISWGLRTRPSWTSYEDAKVFLVGGEKDTEIYNEIGLMFLSQEKHYAAVLALAQALELRPTYSEAEYNLANVRRAARGDRQ